ncbi:MAG: 4Fe-4S dicluster domain-containing protein [Chloroflexi bacterium]|nr:4Fe-4S dicluster domain-containing protein [Chloroflexota bacterium]
MCIQCGTCGGSCPSGQDMDHTPRQLFAMIRADMRDEVLRSNTPWYCVSCYFAWCAAHKKSTSPTLCIH